MAISVRIQKKILAAHDESPSIVNDHPFEPRGAWYTQCRHCGLAMAAHKETTVDPKDHIGQARPDVSIGYMGDDEEDE